jgi:hypothetical protein
MAARSGPRQADPSGDTAAASLELPAHQAEWQKFLDSVDRVVGDALEDVAQIGFGVQSAEFCRTDPPADSRT